jgi:general secretion pathway protein D
MFFRSSLLLISSAFFLSSCQKAFDHNSPKLTKKDLSELSQPSAGLPKNSPQRKLLSFPKQTSLIPEKMKKKVSLSLNETISLKEPLVELARQIDIDLQLDPQISSKMVYSAKDRPFIEIIEDICEAGNLRYKIKGNSLKIENDTPYPYTYNVQFLNLSRTTENHISVATDVFSSVQNRLGTADNGSNSSVNAKAQSDFWIELETNLKTLLGADGKGENRFSIHKQGGMITIVASSKEHKVIDDYFQKLKQVVGAQVLIEAKVIEVSLNEQYRSGINWQKIAGGYLNFDAPFGTIAQRPAFMDPTSAQGDMISLGLKGKSFTGIIKAIEEFGGTRTLSSPRLTVMNNQTSILKVAQNQVYFRLNYDKQFNLNINRESISVSSDIQTVPIGLVMSVQPSIDQTTGDIILSLRPTISRLSKSVNDPAVDIAFNANHHRDSQVQPKPSLVPIVEVREIDSVLRLKTGQIAVLGGLMEKRDANTNAKLPGAGDIPVLGNLFQSTANTEELVELVILLKATIIEDTTTTDTADQRLYEDYIEDPRQWNLRSEENSLLPST